MRTRPLLAIAIAAIAALVAACTTPGESPSVSDARDRSANEAAANWQAKHERDYRRDWVSIAGLYDL